jgi:hypothetical protein
MQLRRTKLLICAESILLFYTSAVSAITFTLVPGEEPVTPLLSPSNQSPLQGASVNIGGVSSYVYEPITASPLVCGNTSAPASLGTSISPIYYSPTGIGNLKPFVFGASSANPTQSAIAFGASLTMSYAPTGTTFSLVNDPATVCYDLNAVTGLHGPTPGVMRDGFQGLNDSPTWHKAVNSSVVLNVFHLPTNSTDYYGYTIDVTIQPLDSSFSTLCLPPAGTGSGQTGIDCNFALTEGFDSSVFDASSGTGTSGQWCLAPAGAQTCGSPPPSGGTSPAFGNININYTNYASTGISLAAPIAPAAAKQFHFVAYRKFTSGVSALPASGGPVVIAALFSPFDLDENDIGDNVAVGYANDPPSVATDDNWSLFTNHLANLAENADSGILTFDITDADSVESGSNVLTAAVTINLAGLQVPITPSCALTSTPGATPVNRHCTLDINLSDPNWWNATVDPAYQGQANVFATDPGGVAASASIITTDALGKSSTPVTVPIHVQSKVNNAPIAVFSSQFTNSTGPGNGALLPTFSCAVHLGGNPGGCGVVQRGSTSLSIDLGFSAQPGPAAAFDELASQTTAITAFNDGNGGNVSCDQQQTTVFVAQGNPQVTAVAGAGTASTSYNMNILLSPTAPASPVSTVCTLQQTIVDQMQGAQAFPTGEVAANATQSFRVVVNP